MFDGISSCCCCEKISTGILLSFDIIFGFQYSIILSSGRYFLYMIHIIIHTIKDAVGIPKYATCRISGGCRLNRKVPHYVVAVEIIHHWIHERKTCFIYWCTGIHVCWWKPRCNAIISIKEFIWAVDCDVLLSLFVEGCL